MWYYRGMSFSGFLALIPKPTRWWRRPRNIQVTLWPDWLARALCPHEVKDFFSDDKTIWRCRDCYMFHFPKGIK